MYCLRCLNVQNQDLAKRTYAYFVFRLRQPEDAERLTRLTLERIWERERLSRGAEEDPEMRVFATARAVIADNPRQRGASKVGSAPGHEGTATGLGNEVAMAIGRLHGR